MEGFNRGTITSTAIHEVYPGHYTQFLWLQAAPSKTRKLLYNASNAEGWAHYTEQMMLDEGYGNHDRNLRLGQLLDALLRNARFIVGIEMHTGKMTLEQGQEFFVKEGFQVPPVAEVEAKRGHFGSHVSLLQSGQAPDPEVARGLPETAGQQVHPAGIPRQLHAAGFGAHEDHSQEHAGDGRSDSVISSRDLESSSSSSPIRFTRREENQQW